MIKRAIFIVALFLNILLKPVYFNDKLKLSEERGVLMFKHFYYKLIVSILPIMLVLPAMAINVDNWDDFVSSAKADVEEGQTKHVYGPTHS